MFDQLFASVRELAQQNHSTDSLVNVSTKSLRMRVYYIAASIELSSGGIKVHRAAFGIGEWRPDSDPDFDSSAAV